MPRLFVTVSNGLVAEGAVIQTFGGFTVVVGRSPSWQGRQVAGVGSPARWNRALDHELHCVTPPFRWHDVQSPSAFATEWSNCTPGERAALAAVRRTAGRELAWQSTQEAGCGRFAAVKDAWKSAGVVPA